MIELQNVSKIYSKRNEGVRSVSYTFDDGKIYGIVGPNGAGKTTLINIIAGAHTQTSGTVLIENLDTIRDREESLMKVGWMPDSSKLNGFQKIIDQFEYFGAMRGLDYREAGKKGMELMIRFGLPKNIWNKTMQKLSLGQRRRVSLAFAVLNDPKNIVMDEPYNGFDPDGIRMISDFILEEKSKGKTIIVSSHILKELESIADNVILFENGMMKDEIGIEKLNNSRKVKIILEVKNPDENLLPFLSRLGDARRIGNTYQVITEQGPETDDLNTTLVKNGYVVLSFKNEKQTIEDFYFSNRKRQNN